MLAEAAQEFNHTKFGGLLVMLITLMRFVEHLGKAMWGRVFDKDGSRSRPIVKMDPEMMRIIHDIARHQDECTKNQLDVAHALERLSDRVDHQTDKTNDKLDDLRVQIAAAGKIV